MATFALFRPGHAGAAFFIAVTASAQVSNVDVVDPAPVDEVRFDQPVRIAVPITDTPGSSPTASPTAIATLDLQAGPDGDEFHDVVLSGPNRLYLMRNEPTPGFRGLQDPEVIGEYQTVAPGGGLQVAITTTPFEILGADVTGDGSVELVAAWTLPTQFGSFEGIDIFRFDDAGGLVPVSRQASLGDPTAITGADFDDNGVEDVVYGLPDGGGVFVQFFCPETSQTIEPCGQRRVDVDAEKPLFGDVTGLAVGDFDGDGAPDIVASVGEVGSSAPGIAVFLTRIDGSGSSFETQTLFPTPGVATTGVAAGDIDGDGLADVAVTLLLADPDPTVDTVFTAVDVLFSRPTVDGTQLLRGPTPGFPYEVAGGASAVAVADLGPVRPRSVRADGSLAPVAAGDGLAEVLVANNGADGENGALVVLSIDRGETLLGRIVERRWDLDDSSGIAPSDITDVAVGRFDDNDTIDVVLTDRANDHVILLRNQPPPCATYITMPVHGDLAVEGVFLDLLGTPSPQEFIDRFEAALTERALLINGERRPGQLAADDDAEADLCPIRHIEVHGRWEEASAVGSAARIVAGRGGWLTSTLTPAPSCLLVVGVLPAPALSPTAYWASLILLPLPCLATFPLPAPDPALVTRALLGGIGAGSEANGVALSAAYSRVTAVEMGLALRGAMEDARAGMDACTGQLYVDAMGYSRGGPILSLAVPIATSTTDASRYNAKVSVVHLDAIDASPFDTPRPWGRTGFFFGDPLVVRSGNEVISSFDAFFPGPFRPLDELAQAFLPLRPIGSALVNIVGVPQGHDRRDTLSRSLFDLPDADEHFVDVGLVHGEMHVPPSGFLDPANVDAPGPMSPTGPNPAQFSFAATTSLGRLMPVDENARLGDVNATGVAEFPPNELGWHPLGVGPAEEENAHIPAACLGAVPPVATPLDPVVVNALRQSYGSNSERREFVDDPRFRSHRGLVKNAQDLLETTNGDPKAALPTAEVSELLVQIVHATADSSFPSQGVWRRAGDDDVVLGATGREDFQTSLAEDIAGPLVRFDSAAELNLDDPASVDAVAAEVVQGLVEVEGELQSLWDMQEAEPSRSELKDRIHLFSSIASGAASTADTFAQFGPTEGRVEQHLHTGSLLLDRLVIQLDLELTGSDGFVEVGLHGGSLDFSARHDADAHGTGSVVTVEMVAHRAVAGGPIAGIDSIALSGKNARVYRVSVTRGTPKRNPATGIWYELKLIEGGNDFDVAALEAVLAEHEGREGRLATLRSVADIAFLQEAFDLDVPAWVGASGLSSSPSTWHWVSGERVADAFFDEDAFGAEPRRPLHAFVLPKGAGTKLAQSQNAIVRAGKPFGYFVEYLEEPGVRSREERREAAREEREARAESLAPPVPIITGGLSHECTSPLGASLSLSGASSHDAAGEDIARYEWRLGGRDGDVVGIEAEIELQLPLGTTEIVLIVESASGWIAHTSRAVQVVDTTPPEIVDLEYGGPRCLWPPNHEYVVLDVERDFNAIIIDACDAAPVIVLSSASSSQPDNGEGDGDTVNDTVVFPDRVCLRAERAGGDRDGRVYSVHVDAVDASGNRNDPIVEVAVPHDQRPGTRCHEIGSERVDDGHPRCDLPGDGTSSASSSSPLPTRAGGCGATPDAGLSLFWLALSLLTCVRRRRSRAG